MSRDEIVREIQEHYQNLMQAVVDARLWHQTHLENLKDDLEIRRGELQKTFEDQKSEIQTEYEQSISQAEQELLEVKESHQWRSKVASELQAIVSDWTDPVWQEYAPNSNATVPSCVRVGQLAITEESASQFDLPALAHFVGKGHLFIQGNDSIAMRALLQNIILRLILTFPPGSLRLILTDVVEMGTQLAAFLQLPDVLRNTKVFTSPEEIKGQLDELTTHVETVFQQNLRNLYQNIEEFNQSSGEMAVPYRVIVLPDFPAGFDDVMAAKLMGIARNGVRAGVYVVATINTNEHKVPRDFDLNSLLASGTLFTLDDEGRVKWNDPQFGDYDIHVDAVPAIHDSERWINQVAEAAEQVDRALPTERILIPQNQRWTGDASFEITVPVGINQQGEFHEFSVGLRTDLQHALIGGMIGSGKTNLVHIILIQLALKYSPDEIEFYIVDFRGGVEFEDYLRLPHARVVALESEREFALSILLQLKAEMETRAQLFRDTARQYGMKVENLGQYRQVTGNPLPRKFFFMDEFQVLFETDDWISREAEATLEGIVRLSRIFSIHILLSSQSPSNASMSRYNNQIYNQIGVRVAFKCREQDAEAILGSGNDAASRLENPGEAIYNDGMGFSENNSFVRIALMENRNAYIEEIRELIGERSYPQPLTFEKYKPARIEDCPLLLNALKGEGTASQDTTDVWLGQPIAIHPVTMVRFLYYFGMNMLVVGNDEDQAYGLFTAMMISIAAQRAKEEAQFVVADFTRPNSPRKDYFEQLGALLPIETQIVGPRDTSEAVDRLYALTQKRVNEGGALKPEVFFFVNWLNRWRDLRSSGSYGYSSYEGSDDSFGDSYSNLSLSEKLLYIADQGPEVGIHLTIWVDSLATLNDALERDSVKHFDMRVLFRTDDRTSNDLLGNHSAALLGDNRAFFRNEEWPVGQVEKFKPYIIPEPDTLAEITNKINALRQ